jgi:hypothetical protein
MKKSRLLLIIIVIMWFVFIFIFTGYSQEKSEHQPIVENVEVNWWQVPIFAVDKDGSPIIDLKETDIEIWLDNRRIETFTFDKRAFTASEETGTAPGEPKKESQPSLQQKKNTIFLLFDVSMSALSCTKNSKEIARDIINQSGPAVQFIAFTIEPFKGLKYITGPSDNKQELLNEIEEKVKGKPNERTMDVEKFFDTSALAGSGRQQRASARGGTLADRRLYLTDKDLLRETAATYYLRKTRSFFDAFESLYLIFNSIQDNKFVYFFTEGISNHMQENLMGGRALYQYHLKKMSRYLGRSGAVLFILNPMGVHDGTTLITEQKKLFNPDIDPVDPYSGKGDEMVGTPTSYFTREESRSGERWLRYLAIESGGKYLEGQNEAVVKTLEQMNRAFYEISFQDIPGLKGSTRKISIKPKREGISIHSLRSLERNKRYAEMNKIEKEILAVNLITLSPLMKTSLTCQHARITQIKKSKNNVTYMVLLPGNFLNQPLDLYTFWVKDDLEVANVKTQSLVPKKEKIKIQFDQKGKKAPGYKPYFTLVNAKLETALVRVIGDEWTDAEEPQEPARPIKTGSISAEELQFLLDNAAGYCEKVKNSAFHFICKEKIVESRDSLRPQVDVSPDISDQSELYPERPFHPMRFITDEVTAMKSYTFSYRLLKSGIQIQEEREWLSSKDNIPMSPDQVVKPTAFFSQRAIFAPLTLLARERQDRYDFRFIGFDAPKGLKAAVIEVTPRHQEEENTVYGKIWIDLADYSVLKIEADPRSIIGYRSLKKLEKQLNARLFLTLEIYFDEIHDGIRFPTEVLMVEKYKGGRYVSTYRGPDGWERNRTAFTYADYQFFDVNVEVSIDKR